MPSSIRFSLWFWISLLIAIVNANSEFAMLSRKIGEDVHHFEVDTNSFSPRAARVWAVRREWPLGFDERRPYPQGPASRTILNVLVARGSLTNPAEPDTIQQTAYRRVDQSPDTNFLPYHPRITLPNGRQMEGQYVRHRLQDAPPCAPRPINWNEELHDRNNLIGFNTARSKLMQEAANRHLGDVFHPNSPLLGEFSQLGCDLQNTNLHAGTFVYWFRSQNGYAIGNANGHSPFVITKSPQSRDYDPRKFPETVPRSFRFGSPSYH